MASGMQASQGFGVQGRLEPIVGGLGALGFEGFRAFYGVLWEAARAGWVNETSRHPKP